MNSSLAQIKSTVRTQTRTYTAFAGSNEHCLAVAGGITYALGFNGSGQCNVPVAAQSGVTAVDAVTGVSFAIKSGQVVGWGISAGAVPILPVPTDAQSGVTQISADSSYVLAIKGLNIIGWGSNADDKLTFPSALTNNTAGLTQVIAGSRPLALKNGQVYTWGTGANPYSPIPSTLLSGVSRIAAVGSTPFALKNGTVYSWGSSAATIPDIMLSGVTGFGKRGPFFGFLKGDVGYYGTIPSGFRTNPELDASGLTVFTGESAICFIKSGQLWTYGFVETGNFYGQLNFDY
jgi:hypothetical protein